jgi:hypothetical protein
MRDPCGAPAHILNALGQISYQFFRASAYVARISDAPNIVENLSQTRRLEVHYPRRTRQGLREFRDSAVPDRANVTQSLGQDYIGSELAQKRFVDGVNCAVLM